MKNHVIIFLFIFYFQNNIVAQVTTNGNTFGAATDYIGWDATIGSPPLKISTTNSDAINFYTEVGTYVNTRMRILPGNPATGGGFVGIGYNFTPSHQLDVVGEINISAPFTNYYMIGNATVLHDAGGGNNFFGGDFSGNFTMSGMGNTGFGWYSGEGLSTGNGNSLFGYMAGNNTILGTPTFTGNNNSFFGNQAGQSNVDGNGNVFISAGSGNDNTDGDYNVFIGYASGFNNLTTNHNTFTGSYSGFFNEADSNVYFGSYSGYTNVTGKRNTFMGSRAGFNNTTDDNVFIGHQSGLTNSTGTHNMFIGMQSGMYNTASDNSFMGYRSGIVNSSGNQNTFGGSQSGLVNTSGSSNTFYGFKAGFGNIGGSNNTYIGNNVAAASTSGSSNTVIGDGANCAATLNHQVAIGDGAVATTASTMILGNNINVGVGLSNNPIGPATRLEVLDGGNVPQLRLSYTNATNARFTDFEVTSSGDLNIKPRGGSLGAVAKSVGINQGSPSTTLEINSPTSGPTGNSGLGNSGLAFTDLSNASTPEPSAFAGYPKGVLSVNSAGKVILVPDEGNLTTCSSFSALDINYVPRFTNNVPPELCKSMILDDGVGHVGINTATPVYTLNNAGTSLFAYDPETSALPTFYSRSKVPFAVKTYWDGNHFSGLAIHSAISATNYPEYDDLNIYVDDDSQVNFENFTGRTNFFYHANTALGYPDFSFLGFNSAKLATIIKDDFGTAPNITTSCRFFVESQDHGATGIEYAAYFNNASNGGVSSGTPLTGIGLGAFSYTELSGASQDNLGGRFAAGNAAGNNVGIFAYADKTCPFGCTMGKSRGGEFAASGSLNNSGIYSNVEFSDANALNYGVDIYLLDNGTTTKNYGVNSRIQNNSANSGNVNYGFKALINDSRADENYGGYFNVTTSASSITNGIYASVPNPNCISGCSEFAGWFNGPTWTSGAYLPSDSTIKKNITDIIDPIAMIMQLNPKSFEFDTTVIPQLNLPQGIHYGVISQEIQQSFPQFVKYGIQPATLDTNGNVVFPKKTILSVNYTEFTAILIGAVKQQQSQIDSLIQVVTNCCANANRPTGEINKDGKSQTIELKNIRSVVLDQNVPNPFHDQTDINYTIPADVKSATLLFYDHSGQVLQTIIIKERGNGSIHVYAPDLSSGIYTYTLIADDKVVDTKRMMKAK
jgi:hypothetical protein